MPILFDDYNSDSPRPVCLSVPHAGRNYPNWIPDALNVPVAKTRPLEDRYADAMISVAVRNGYPALVARAPRLVIDLNRAETDFDPAIVDVGPGTATARPSARARGGLGLIPDRLGATGRLWRSRLTASDLATRISILHRPYHQALGTMLAHAHARHGVAVLLDVHSMPPLTGLDAADIVIGDLWGRSANAALSAVAHEVLSRHGLRTASNVPYAGGHILERHARPTIGVHGLQIEIDRRLYLDSKLDLPGPGLTKIAHAISDLVEALAVSATKPVSWPIAAE